MNSAGMNKATMAGSGDWKMPKPLEPRKEPGSRQHHGERADQLGLSEQEALRT